MVFRTHIVILFITIVVPWSASALTPVERGTLIQQLLQQVAALQIQIERILTARGGEPANIRIITNTLGLGSRDTETGGDVSALQRFLTATGDYTGEATGYFGPLTQEAVQQYQCRALGICSGSPTQNGYGLVGRKTRSAMATNMSTFQGIAPPITGAPFVATTTTLTTAPAGGGGATIPSSAPVIPAPAGCVFANQAVPNGSSITAYQATNAAPGASCNTQTRTCTNGVLSGSYEYSLCSVEAFAGYYGYSTSIPFPSQTGGFNVVVMRYSRFSQPFMDNQLNEVRAAVESGKAVILDLQVFQNYRQRTGDESPVPVAQSIARAEYALNSLAGIPLEAVTIDEENSYKNASYLSEIYTTLKAKYPERTFLQWYSPSINVNVPGVGAWPDLPNDGWMIDQYVMDGSTYSTLLNGLTQAALGKPIYSIVWLSPGWKIGSGTIPDTSWWNTTYWKTFYDQMKLNQQYGVKSSFYILAKVDAAIGASGGTWTQMWLGDTCDKEFYADVIGDLLPALRSMSILPERPAQKPSWIPTYCATDAQRKTDLAKIEVALQRYFNVHGTYQVTQSGWNGNGNGWVSYENASSSYATAVTRVLYNEGFLDQPIVPDPIGSQRNYMLYVCNNGVRYSLSATLSKPSNEDVASVAEVCNGSLLGEKYTKNYAIGN